jgi:SAM-dependent methyltransferase
VDFQVAALSRLPYPDCTFATAVCVRVLPYHLKANIATSIHELWRVLKPGGWLYVDFLDRDDAEYGNGPELEQHTFLDPDGVPIHFSSRQEINELLSGFAPQRVARLELGSRPRVAWVVWATRGAGEQGRNTHPDQGSIQRR